MSPTPSRLLRTLRLSLAPMLLALVAAGCAADEGTGDEDEEGVVSAEDALTSDEAAAGSTWNGHDDILPEEEAALDDPGIPEPGDLAPLYAEPGAGSVRPLAGGCARTTGYRKGTPIKICTTTVNGKAVEVKTAAAYAQMRDAARRAGVNITVVSGFRTMQKQRELYALYKARRGNLAAPPGFSNHQSGHALDLNARAPGVYRWLAANAGRFGFKRTVPSENWHWEHW